MRESSLTQQNGVPLAICNYAVLFTGSRLFALNTKVLTGKKRKLSAFGMQDRTEQSHVQKTALLEIADSPRDHQ